MAYSGDTITARQTLSFYRQRETVGDCELFTGSPKSDYPRFGVGMHTDESYRYQKAHRLSWELNAGRGIPADLQVLHQCDTPRCVNPDHLFLGTNANNVADKVAKGRQKSGTGERQHLAKLTEAQVLEIFHSNDAGVTLANRYNVSPNAVSRIRLRRTWRLVTPESKG